jgi:hypothetical protein
VNKKFKGNEAIKNRLAKNHLCYVLLTCDKTTENGQMEVDMSYEGDPLLASYLLNGAQAIIDEDVECDSHIHVLEDSP